jgi:hypothetical protein
VLAAVGCSIRWKGIEYETDEATIVDDFSARGELKAAFGPVTRLFLRAQSTREFLRLGVSLQDGRVGTPQRTPVY